MDGEEEYSGASAANVSAADREAMIRELNLHVQARKLDLLFPAQVVPSPSAGKTAGNKTLRTRPELVLHRMLEAGVMFDNDQTLAEVTTALGGFVQNLKETGCYDGVKVTLHPGESSSSSNNPDAPLPCLATVSLDETKWYRLYVGGGLRHDHAMAMRGGSSLPTATFETVVGLNNPRGFCDRAEVTYAVDRRAETELVATYQAPLFSMLPEDSWLYQKLLLLPNGSQTRFEATARVDTADHLLNRGYHEFRRSLEWSVLSSPHGSTSGNKSSAGWKLVHKLMLRDVVPRRHPKLPYAYQCPTSVLSQSNAPTNLLHSLLFRLDGSADTVDSRTVPTDGVESWIEAEVADAFVGESSFIRTEAHGAVHYPLRLISQKLAGASVHAGLTGGWWKSFGRAAPHPSDRFYRSRLAGFTDEGIGPRTGDYAIGGTAHWKAGASVSIPLVNANPALRTLRGFGFVQAGSLWNPSGSSTPYRYSPPMMRVSTGVGVCVDVSALMGVPLRAELTYAVPLRYHPTTDKIQRHRFGFGVSIP